MNSNSTPEYRKNFLNALKEAVDEIVSIDKNALSLLLEERKDNDITRFVMEMGVLEAGRQEAKAAPEFGFLGAPVLKAPPGELNFRFSMIVEPEVRFAQKWEIAEATGYEWSNEFVLNPRNNEGNLMFTMAQSKDIAVAA